MNRDLVISNLAYLIDSFCRNDLFLENLTSERDYVSQFTSMLRNPLGPFSSCLVVNAKTNTGSVEQEFGADSIIIFRFDGYVKIAMFECKWPRYKQQKNYVWDTENSKSTSPYSEFSRFSSQLLRQNKYKGSGIVFWEQFLIEEAPGTKIGKFGLYGSSCILMNDAVNYLKKSKNNDNKQRWDNNDLDKLLPKSKNIGFIFDKILSCSYGKKIKVEDDKVKIKSIEIPTICKENKLTNDNIQLIRNFLNKNGMFKYIDIKLA